MYLWKKASDSPWTHCESCIHFLSSTHIPPCYLRLTYLGRSFCDISKSRPSSTALRVSRSGISIRAPTGRHGKDQAATISLRRLGCLLLNASLKSGGKSCTGRFGRAEMVKASSFSRLLLASCWSVGELLKPIMAFRYADAMDISMGRKYFIQNSFSKPLYYINQAGLLWWHWKPWNLDYSVFVFLVDTVPSRSSW